MTLVDPETGEFVETFDVSTSGYSGLVHHLANRYPMMKQPALDEMALAIAANGQREPVWLDVEGNLIDGRNRLEACRLAGVQPRFAIYEGEDIESFILDKNEHRRDLTAKERKEIRRARAAELRGQGMSTRAIADELEVDAKTVRADLADMDVGTNSPPPSTESVVKGKDGKSYQATRRNWTKKDALTFLAAYEAATPAGKVLIAQAYGLSAKTLPNTASDLRKKFGFTIVTRSEQSQINRARVAELATTSMTADQIAAELGVKRSAVVTYARDLDIEIQGEKAMSHRKRIESNELIERLIAGFDISETVLAMVDYPSLDLEAFDSWVFSLEAAIQSLKDIQKKLTKEKTRRERS